MCYCSVDTQMIHFHQTNNNRRRFILWFFSPGLKHNFPSTFSEDASQTAASWVSTVCPLSHRNKQPSSENRLTNRHKYPRSHMTGASDGQYHHTHTHTHTRAILLPQPEPAIFPHNSRRRCEFQQAAAGQTHSSSISSSHCT